MKEQEFTDELVEVISPSIFGAIIQSGISLLYEMPIDDDGIIRVGVDADTGHAFRGKGTGFEQDIVIYEETEKGHTRIIPRVVAEVKFGRVTTHDAIVYSYKAECIKLIYPYCRYGMVLDDMKWIPGRALRHGRNFDFICTLSYPLSKTEITELSSLFNSELETSRATGAIMKGTKKLRVFQRPLKFTI